MASRLSGSALPAVNPPDGNCWPGQHSPTRSISPCWQICRIAMLQHVSLVLLQLDLNPMLSTSAEHVPGVAARMLMRALPFPCKPS